MDPGWQTSRLRVPRAFPGVTPLSPHVCICAMGTWPMPPFAGWICEEIVNDTPGRALSSMKRLRWWQDNWRWRGWWQLRRAPDKVLAESWEPRTAQPAQDAGGGCRGHRLRRESLLPSHLPESPPPPAYIWVWMWSEERGQMLLQRGPWVLPDNSSSPLSTSFASNRARGRTWSSIFTAPAPVSAASPAPWATGNNSAASKS